MRRLISAITIICVASPVMAIDLTESLNHAYKNNNDLKIIRQNFLDSIENFPRALAGFLPSISTQWDIQDSKNKGKSRFSTSTTERKTTQRSLVIDQPIFNGGGSVASLKAAQDSFRAEINRYYSEEQRLLLESIKAYLDLYAEKEKYDISESSVQSNLKQLEAEEAKFQVGESTITDVAKAKTALANAQTNKLTAYANFQSAKANFVRVFGIEATDTTLPEEPINLPNSLEELIKQAQIHNPSVNFAKHSSVASKSNEWVAKSALLPTVNFRVSSANNYNDPESPNNGVVNSRSVTSSVSVQVPIYSRGGIEHSNVRKAKINTRKASIAYDAQIKQNLYSCVGYWESFSAAKSRILAASQGIEAAQIAYEGTIQEEIVGSKTILELLTAEENLNKAKVAKVEATRDYLLSAYNIKLLIGQLTARHLNLKVDYFNPESEFKKVKTKIIGF